MDKLQLMVEAERRGILPADKAAMLNEARKRGLVPGSDIKPQPKSLVDQIPGDPELNIPKTKKSPTALQNLVGDVADVAGPSIEAAGALGGGFIGAGTMLPTGPGAIAGGAAGAGIGYAAGKNLVNMMNQYAGRREAPTVQNALTQFIVDALEGAAYEVAGPLVGRALAGAASKVVDLKNVPKQRAARIARESLGPDLAAAKGVLRNAPGDITAGQAAANIDSPAFASLVDEALKRKDGVSFLARLTKEQRQGALNRLADIAGATTQTGARSTQQAARKGLGETLEPLKQEALFRANMGEVAPISIDKIIPKLNGYLKNPDFAKNSEIEKSMPLLKKALLEWQEEGGGVIDGRALDSIRKNLVNNILDNTPNSADPNVIKRVNSLVVGKIKPLLIDAIEDAGGVGYRDYLKAYEKGAQAISQKKLGAEALDMFQNNPNQFVKLVEGNAPDEVERIFGPGSYDIVKEMSKDSMESLRQVADTVKRDASFKQQASLGRDALREIMQANSSKFRFPGLLSAKITTANAALDRIQERVGKKTMAVLTEAMKSGKSAAELLDTLPASERSKILNILRNPQVYLEPGTSAAVGTQTINKLSEEEPRQPANALVR